MSDQYSDQPLSELSSLADQAVKLAAEILQASRERESNEEKKRSAMMARMMRDENGKKFTIAMADQVLRMKGETRAAERMDQLIHHYGVPQYFSGTDQLALRAGNQFASWFPKLVMPQVRRKVRSDSEHVIISAEPAEFQRYLKQRRQQQIRVNLNQLGEAVLGDKEAQRRLDDNVERLQNASDVDYVSIKLSAIVSQISLTGYQQTIEKIKPRLREIYRAAIKGGQQRPKFVNLDMEEYRDLDLTVSVFKSVLDEPEFEKFEAGIVLQAYLPDSFAVLQSLTEWARQRKQRTGTGIKVRLVKGANLAMEQVEASLEDWPQAPYDSKLKVDANFKRMLEFATRPENAEVVRLGVGSHNLFDIALAMLLRTSRAVEDRIEFEMLEGMANAQAFEVRDRSGGMLVYSPVVLDAEFEAAIAYLVRRLDENTAPGSFLGALFALREGTPEWQSQSQAFLDACQLAQSEDLHIGPNRHQNRLTETFEPLPLDQPFHNEPDTDFSLPQNRQWADQIQDKWRDCELETVPVQIAGQFHGNNVQGEGHDPSRPGSIQYRYCHATAEQVDQALKTALQAQPAWEAKGVEGRAAVLRSVAAEFCRGRGDSVGVMIRDAGKAIREADVEISEAVDFANFYSRSLMEAGWCDGTEPKPFGVVVVTPPWNFPYAIPAGGVLASLMAGNTVILKPAPESVLVAWQLVQQFWNAGVPQEVLQFVPTDDGETGKSLVSDPRVGAVILTGSIHTARLFQSWRPELKLFAETSGKNAMIITAAADLDLAVKDLVRGAFGHAGQKCSATSLALIERKVYEDPKFRQQLVDAASSLEVGGAWDPSAIVTPVIREPDEILRRGLTDLQDGESWLLEPKMVDNNPCLWSPGIRLDVKPDSWYHRNECFGPVLGLICVDNLDEAIEIQNSSEFGLTGGIHSLDPDEIVQWRETVEVGNAYINRGTTGAIVQRQPFGGWKNSCVGSGPKAGGRNYVATFATWTEASLPELRAKPTAEVRSTLSRLRSLMTQTTGDQAVVERIQAAAENYAYWYQNEFSLEHDPSQLHGETNDFRYRHRPLHLVRVELDDPKSIAQQLALIALACQTVGTPLEVSVDQSRSEMAAWLQRLDWAAPVRLVYETQDKLLTRLKQSTGATIRVYGGGDPAHSHRSL